MINLEAHHDPFVTSLDLAVEAAGFRNAVDFNNAIEDAAWAALTTAERAEMYEYSNAKADNAAWDRMIVRQISKTRPHYTDRDGWHRVAWSDDEKRREREQFQGRA